MLVWALGVVLSVALLWATTAAYTAANNATQPPRESAGAPSFLGILGRVRMDQVETKSAEKKLADEARSRPVAFARRFRDVAGLFLGCKSAIAL